MDKHDDELARLRTRVRDLELALGQRDDKLAVTFRLTPTLRNLLGLLLNVQVVTQEMIRQRLEIAPDAKVAMHRLRKSLEPWSITIHNRRTLGYWIEDEDKARIRGLVAARLRNEGVTEIAEVPAPEADTPEQNKQSVSAL